jgi:hypothetical protein
VTTVQLVIVCATVLGLAAVSAAAVLKVRRLEIGERTRLAELDAADKARREHTQRLLDQEKASPLDVGPALGATLVVHVDGRVVQGTLAVQDTRTRVVLSDASIVDGGRLQPLGGARQYITAARVTQIQEL